MASRVYCSNCDAIVPNPHFCPNSSDPEAAEKAKLANERQEAARAALGGGEQQQRNDTEPTKVRRRRFSS